MTLEKALGEYSPASYPWGNPEILYLKFSSSGINLAFIPAFETLEITQADGSVKEVTANKWIPTEI